MVESLLRAAQPQGHAAISEVTSSSFLRNISTVILIGLCLKLELFQQEDKEDHLSLGLGCPCLLRIFTTLEDRKASISSMEGCRSLEASLIAT